MLPAGTRFFNILFATIVGSYLYEHEFGIVWGVTVGRGGVARRRSGGWQLSHNTLGQKVLR